VRIADAAPADQGTAAVGATASAVASAQLSAEFDAGGAAAAATGVNPAAAAAATQLAAALTSGAVSAPPVSAPPRDDADHEMEAVRSCAFLHQQGVTCGRPAGATGTSIQRSWMLELDMLCHKHVAVSGHQGQYLGAY